MHKKIILIFIFCTLCLQVSLAEIVDLDEDGVPDIDDDCLGSTSVIIDENGCDCSQKDCGMNLTCSVSSIEGAECMIDYDGDGVGDFDSHQVQIDNCPKTHNPSQDDRDNDGIGDVCDDIAARCKKDSDCSSGKCENYVCVKPDAPPISQPPAPADPPVDEGLTFCEDLDSGECAYSTECRPQYEDHFNQRASYVGCEECNSSPEVCDGMDNDCDGNIDELDDCCEGLGKNACENNPHCNADYDGNWFSTRFDKCEVASCDGLKMEKCLAHEGCSPDFDSSWFGTSYDGCRSCTASPEICDNKDNDCDGQVDMVDGHHLTRIDHDMKYFCQKGEWKEKICTTVEVCSDKEDSDCDGLLPEQDSDCVKKASTKPGWKWKTRWKINYYGRCSCSADAWATPDFKYNPAKHSMYGMDPNSWTCVAEKIHHNDALQQFVGNGWSYEDIGKVWIANHVYSSLPGIVKDALKLFLKDEIKEMKLFASDLPRPNAYAYTYCLGTKSCYDLDSVYTIKRDWVCFHNELETDKYFSWHDKKGTNWMSGVRDQDCEDCWAFSTIGVVEGQLNIDENQPGRDIDLSEQEIVSCSGGGTCAKGGKVGRPLNYIKNQGINTETCYPYEATDSSCKNDDCGGKRDIADVDLINPNRETIKYILRNHGPLTTCMDWGKFMRWDDGIGYCNGGKDDSGHCLTLVGYSDYGNYWILKNSAGLGIGDSGYNMIGYGECRMESYRGTIFMVE